MIRIHRPSTEPAVLLAEGRRLRDEHLAQHAKGDVAFMFDGNVYAHTDVKTALRLAQHDKCGFCESKVSHVAYGDVEHFRPKAAFRAGPGGTLDRPGYFWLAYEWTNLLFACQLCNQRYKGNLFPLLDETTRARTPTDDLAREVPLFIDPASEDPAVHIGFREEYPYAIGGSVRGQETVRALGLDRPPLVERRRERLEQVRTLRRAADTLKRNRDHASKALVEEIEAQLRKFVSDEAEYSAMLRNTAMTDDCTSG